MSARRWMFAAAVLVSCAVPELDRTGAIVCGTADSNGVGLCPSGYECRLEHCCPTDASASTCPSFAAATVGAPCTANACTATSTAACCAAAPKFPGGYTTTPGCTSNAACGDLAECVSLSFIDTTACVRRCTYHDGAVTPCRASAAEVAAAPSGSYVCIPDPEGRAPTDGVCIPDCTSNAAVCPTGTQCNSTTHNCVRCTGTDCGGCVSNPAQCTGGTTCNRTSRECGRCSLTVAAQACPSGLVCNPLTGRCR